MLTRGSRSCAFCWGWCVLIKHNYFLIILIKNWSGLDFFDFLQTSEQANKRTSDVFEIVQTCTNGCERVQCEKNGCSEFL